MFKSKTQLLAFLELIEAFLQRKDSIEDAHKFNLMLDFFVSTWIKG